MKRILRIAAGVVVAAALQTGAANAQLNQLMRHNVNNDATNAFGCATACTSGGPEQRCNAFRRVWADLKPTQVNTVAPPNTNCEKDGFPRFGSAPLRLVGDVITSQNFIDSNNNANACEAWMSSFDAAVNPNAGNFISYYGIGSTVINFGEVGNGFCPNCLRGTDTNFGTTCNTQSNIAADNSGMCFGALGIIGESAAPVAAPVIAAGATAADNSPNTPIGTDLDADPPLETRGGLEPVPVPRVVSSNTGARTMVVAWDTADNQVRVNRPGTGVCPSGTTFEDEQTNIVAPTAIQAMRLFVHKRGVAAANRTLVEMEGTTAAGGVLGVFGNAAPANSYCSSDAVGTLPGTACPGMHILPCNAAGVTGGVCATNGIDFSPASQSITLSELVVNTALGTDGPIMAGEVGVFNTKVVYMGATDAHSAGGDGFTNPKLVSLFSAHSTPFSFQGLVSGVQFDSSATAVRGNRVTLSWTTVGGPFNSFALSRALDGVSFEPVATIPGSAEPTYTFTDEIKGRASASIWYRLIYTDVSGGTGQALTEVSLRSGGRR